MAIVSKLGTEEIQERIKRDAGNAWPELVNMDVIGILITPFRSAAKAAATDRSRKKADG